MTKARIGDLVMFDEENQKYKTPWKNQIGIVIETRSHERCVIQWVDGSTSIPELRILEILNKREGVNRSQ